LVKSGRGHKFVRVVAGGGRGKVPLLEGEEDGGMKLAEADGGMKLCEADGTEPVPEADWRETDPEGVAD